MHQNSESSNRPNPRDDTVSLLDLLYVLVKRRKFIVVTTGAIGILILLYAAYTVRAPAEALLNLLPNKFTPVVAVRLQESDSSSFSSALQDTSLGLLAGLSGEAGGPSNAELAMALLRGKEILDSVAEEFNIVKRYGITKNPRTTSRKLISEATSAEYNTDTGIMTITFTDIDPVFATDVLNALLDGLETRFKDLTMESVKSRRDFLVQRIAEVESDLGEAQQSLIAFQRKHGIFDLGLQTQKQIEEISNLNSAITSLELDLMSLLEYRREDDPQVLRIRKEIERNKVLLESKQSGFGDFSVKSIPQEQLLDVQATYLSLRRDLAILDSIYLMLREQFEKVKIEEKDNSRVFQVVERAEIPEMKSRPSRSMLVVIVTFAGFIFSILYSFILEYFERAKQDPDDAQKLEEIKAMLRRKKRRS